MSEAEEAVRRRNALSEYRKQLLNCKEIESRIRAGWSRDTVLVRVRDSMKFSDHFSGD